MRQVNIPKSILKDLYINKKLSMAKIAKRFHCSPTTIQRIMREYKIKSRNLSEAAEKVLILKQTLKKLYYRNKLSTIQIGKLYRCSHATVLNKMKKYGLKRRSQLGLRKQVFISKAKLKRLYLDKKFSENQISRKMNCSRCAVEKLMKKYKIKPHSLSEAQMKYPKYDFSGNLIEKAYLIGFRLGDLSVGPARLQIQVECSTSRPEQVRLIKTLFQRYGRIIIRQNRFVKGKLITDIKCLLNNSFEFLLPKRDRIEPWILRNKKFFFAFLAGYIDAEGHIFTRLQKKSKTPTAGLQIQSYDKSILHQIWSKLNKMRIKSPRPYLSHPKGYVSKDGVINRDDSWRLDINRKKALFFLLSAIEPYIKHEKRKRKLLEAKKNLILRLKDD
jgi:predicted DNA-binding protein YlxM (UPF0122 family)